MREQNLEPDLTSPTRREVIERLRAPTFFYGVLVVGAPLVAVLVWHAPAPVIAASWAGGLILWTFFEYAFHRWAQHNRRIVRLIRRWDDHSRHHADPTELDDFVYTLGETLPVGALVTGIAVALSPSIAIGLAWAAGFIAGYLVFEWVHAASHSPDLCRGHAWLERWSSHHARHHWERGNAFYGFITRFWDRVLGTCPPPKRRPTDRLE